MKLRIVKQEDGKTIPGASVEINYGVVTFVVEDDDLRHSLEKAFANGPEMSGDGKTLPLGDYPPSHPKYAQALALELGGGWEVQGRSDN